MMNFIYGFLSGFIFAIASLFAALIYWGRSPGKDPFGSIKHNRMDDA